MLRLSLRECVRQLRPALSLALTSADDGPSGGENQVADSELQFFQCTSFCTEMATIHSLELASNTGSVSDLPESESPRFGDRVAAVREDQREVRLLTTGFRT